MEQNETVSAPESTQGSEPALETRRRRLVFRARHRGTFETDILIGGFVDRNVDRMDAEALTDMEAVLEMPDPDLSDWLFGRLPLPKERETPMLVAMIRDCRAQRGED